MKNKSTLLQNDSVISRYTKKLPKLYLIIFGVLLTALLFLLYNYISLSSSNKNKLKEYNMILASNDNLIIKTKLTEGELKDINEQINKNELTIDEIDKSIKNNNQIRSNLLHSIADLEMNMNSFQIDNQKATQIQLLKDEYAKLQNELDIIQTDIYSKTTFAHSNVLLSDLEEKKLIEEWVGKKIGLPCYLSDVDGFSTRIFYKRCSKKGPTITLYQSLHNRFGGYTSTSFEFTGDPIYKNDPDTFLFSLDLKRKYLPTNTDKVILNSEEYFPSFGNDVLVSESATQSKFPDTYGDKIKDRNMGFFYKKAEFDLIRIEVFLLE